MSAVEARIDACVLWLRALLMGSLAFFLGVVGHVSADGLLPGPLLLAVMLAMSVLLSAPMLSRPASTTRIVAMLVGGQTLLHLVLSVTAGHAGDRTAAAVATRTSAMSSLPVVDGRRLGSLQDAYTGASDQPGGLAPTLPVGHLIGDLSAHAPMMVAHLVVAALVGLWLGYGERCLWTVLALTGRRILAATWALRPVVRAPRLTFLDAVLAPAGPRSVWLVRPDSRRGPPLLAA
ncbi:MULTISPECIES: hypothetical protein [unclassified Nocardioides]|uniref:hypothetical protein n=1 Tax=unclassified Nocardioides TaxID=2615069 RepID=UPI000A45971F|nr:MULTISPECIES: hypothetical protein [unclassified Nocardioides]